MISLIVSTLIIISLNLVFITIVFKQILTRKKSILFSQFITDLSSSKLDKFLFYTFYFFIRIAIPILIGLKDLRTQTVWLLTNLFVLVNILQMSYQPFWGKSIKQQISHYVIIMQVTFVIAYVTNINQRDLPFVSLGLEVLNNKFYLFFGVYIGFLTINLIL